MWTAIDRSSARPVGAGRIVLDDLVPAFEAPDLREDLLLNGDGHGTVEDTGESGRGGEDG